MPDLTAEDFNISRDVTPEDLAYHNELRNSGQMSADHYEWKPVFDHEYTGPRFKYGLKNGSYNVATVPKGEIQQSHKPEEKELGSIYGTIEYPYALTEEQLTNFQLIDFQAVKTINAKDFKQIVHDIIDHDVFRETVAKSIQNDGQKVLDAIFSEDVAALQKINNKYAPEAGRNQGGGGAGPGKPKQPRRGAEPVYNASLIAINGFKKDLDMPTLDPAAQKYLDDRQKHNDQADEHNRLRRVGQEALPGIRFADAAKVGRVWESKEKGDITESDWEAYKNQLISENAEGDFSVFKPFMNWKDTYSKQLQSYLRLNDNTIPVADTHYEATPNTDKIKILALALAKHQDETLSYGEIGTLTGLTKDDIDEHWIAAQTIAVSAVKDANAKDLSYQIDRHTHLYHSGPAMVIYSQSESNLQDEPMFWSNATGWGSLSEETSTFTKAELNAINIIHITTSGIDAVSMPYQQAEDLVELNRENHKHDTASIKGNIVYDHAIALQNACELRLQNDPSRYDFTAEQHKLDQAEYIITNINQHDLKNHVFKLDYQATMGGNPLAHENEDRRQSIITQVNAFKQDIAEKNDPEAALRKRWTEKGVSQERQEEILADITAKAAPGAQIGPFTIPVTNCNTTKPQTGGKTMENPVNETVPANTEFNLTGTRLAEKLSYLEKTQSTKLAYLEKHLNDLKTMPESTESTNRRTGEVFTTTKAQTLAALARKEAIDAMSKGEYVSNIIEMGKINKKRASGEISSEDIEKHAAMKAVDIKLAATLAAKDVTPEAAAEAKKAAAEAKIGYVPNTTLVRFDKINTRNAKLGKEFSYKHAAEQKDKTAFMEANPAAKKEDIPLGPASKAFNAAFYFNCTESGIKDQIEKVTKKHDIVTNLLAKVNEVPDCKFVITIKEQRNLPNLSYDQNFLKQLDVALAAKNAPAPAEPEKSNKPKGRSRK